MSIAVDPRMTNHQDGRAACSVDPNTASKAAFNRP